jgi:hypothetical protein
MTGPLEFFTIMLVSQFPMFSYIMVHHLDHLPKNHSIGPSFKMSFFQPSKSLAKIFKDFSFIQNPWLERVLSLQTFFQYSKYCVRAHSNYLEKYFLKKPVFFNNILTKYYNFY